MRPTTEQIRKAAEIAIHGAIGVTEGEALAQVEDDNGEFVREIGFRLRNEEQDGEIRIWNIDDETGEEEELRFRVRLERI